MGQLTDAICCNCAIHYERCLKLLIISGPRSNDFGDFIKQLDPVSDLEALITEAIDDDAPISVTDGGLIKSGFNQQLDSYRKVTTNGKQWLADLEATEREATGINSLKLGTIRFWVLYRGDQGQY
ncbi:DNA mismatch repair protein mutS [Weissella viridescens]|uniref:DNA mismatch repair protein mutS n=1 Tax=Weissella viridescens TaxID=1629 RepID=A0A380NZX2_WEIVI|nr:DNA mismatch repair protein mutS [Weissella viridescens]